MSVYSIGTTDPSIATAIEDNLCAYARAFGLAPDAKICERAGYLWLITRIPTLPFTGILRPYPDHERLASTIAAIMGDFQQRNARPSWIFNPARAAPDMPNHLAHYQLRQTADLPGMAIELQAIHTAPDPPRIQIAPVSGLDTLAAWIHVYAISNGAPDWIQQELHTLFAALLREASGQLHLYLAYHDEQPAATAATFRAAGVVGLYEVATLPEVRRQGLGTVITRYALATARQEGYHVATLLSSAMAAQLYQRLGFQEYCRLQIYN